MTGRIVCDASAVAALLLDSGPDGNWVANMLAPGDLAAPSLIGFETANVIRRRELTGAISADQAAQAHAELLELPIEHWPHEVLAGRAWELRENLTAYDASYVALAELTESRLVTLDARLARAPGIRCEIAVPA